jgi:hypothetical protein
MATGSLICDEVTKMSTDPSPIQEPPKKKHKHQKSQLRVVFDTNALYVASISLGSASDLVRQEIADLIAEAKYPDLDILWYLPEVVRHERQYQMQTEALKLRSAINRIERLLGHNLALTDQILLDHVETKINEKEKALQLREIKLDHNKVDWSTLIHAANYRLPPFSPGEKEKGFRDAIVAESLLQLAADSPKTPKLCRVVLVTSDELLSEAVNDRISGLPGVSVLPSIEELKGLINTLVSDVDEEFIARLKPKANKLFFTSKDDKDTLYYKEDVRGRITEQFKVELAARPEGTTFRSNGKWLIGQPNFARKEGRRIFWTSRIDIEIEAGNITNGRESAEGFLGPFSSEGLKMHSASYGLGLIQPSLRGTLQTPHYPSLTTSEHKTVPLLGLGGLGLLSQNIVVSQKGRDVYEVLWSTEVTLAKELKKGQIEEIKPIDITWQPIS